jgi:hypothetical protein
MVATTWDLKFTDTELMDYTAKMEYGRSLIFQGQNIIKEANLEFGKLISQKRSEQIEEYKKNG